ncbi:Diacylglycerol O-acyltransferase 1 [Hanseniaspora uvarum DSM 2768]|nr:Diacylglycerol O-acyltransferase 1 [Hanseniaspora uvarum DSM 2768]
MSTVLLKNRRDNALSTYTNQFQLYLERGFQNIAVISHISMMFISTAFAICLFGNPFLLFTVSIPYLIFYMVDRSPGNGKVMRFRYNWWKNLNVWKYYCDYFQINIIKATDLEPTFKDIKTNELYSKDPMTYIFGYHPHGIAALASFGLSNNGCGFQEQFPGINMSLLTLTNNFQLPFYREYLLMSGLSSVSKKNITKLLQNYTSICLVPGGAKESLAVDFSGNKINLVLKNRKGFVRLAVDNVRTTKRRTSLVPIFSFGENELYKVVNPKEGSFLRKLQVWLKNNIGFTIPIFFGRGIWNTDFGLMPYREKVTLCFGEPIEIDLSKYDENTPEEEIVDHFHGLYIDELLKIFDENKDKYNYSDKVINFVD